MLEVLPHNPRDLQAQVVRLSNLLKRFFTKSNFWQNKLEFLFSEQGIVIVSILTLLLLLLFIIIFISSSYMQ